MGQQIHNFQHLLKFSEFVYLKLNVKRGEAEPWGDFIDDCLSSLSCPLLLLSFNICSQKIYLSHVENFSENHHHSKLKDHHHQDFH